MHICFFSKNYFLGIYSFCSWRLILQKEGNKKNFHFLYNSFKNKIKNLWPEGIVAVKLSQLSYKYALWNVALKKITLLGNVTNFLIAHLLRTI